MVWRRESAGQVILETMTELSREPEDSPALFFQQPPADDGVVAGVPGAGERPASTIAVHDSFVSNEMARPVVREGVQPTVLSYYSDPSGQPVVAGLSIIAVVLVSLAAAGIIASYWMWPIIISAIALGVVLRDTEEVVFADSGIYLSGVTSRKLDWADVAQLVVVRGAVPYRIGGRPNRNAAALYLKMRPNSLGETTVHQLRIEAAKANRFAQWAQAKQVPTSWLDASADLAWRDRLDEIGSG